MNYKVGDKVEIPLTKSRGCSWENSLVFRDIKALEQNYLYIVDIYKDECELHYFKDASVGERFLLSEVKLWSEQSNTWETVEVIQNINEEIKEEESKR